MKRCGVFRIAFFFEPGECCSGNRFVSQQLPSENPYEVLSSSGGQPDFLWTTADSETVYQIVNDQIVCGPVASLPECCLQSGGTQDLVRYHRRTLRRVPPPAILLLFFLAPGWMLFAILWYYSPTRCIVSFSLSRSYLAVRRTQLILGLIAAGAGQFLALSGVVNHPLSISSGILIFSAGLFFVLRNVATPIWITRHLDKQRFWLTGCSRTALNALERLQQDPSQRVGSDDDRFELEGPE